MTPRDYKRPAKRPARRKGKGVSGWAWFLVGACVGALATTGLFLYEPTVSGGGRADGASASQQGDRGRRPRFEFYTVLPEKEIAIPEAALEEPVPRRELRQAGSGDERYLLQVGSFRKLTDADRLKAKLAFLGLEASIQTVSIDGAESWHRVRLGPFEGRDELNEARARLRENKFDVLVLKLK